MSPAVAAKKKGSAAPQEGCAMWKANRVFFVAKKICHEISNTIAPFELRKAVSLHKSKPKYMAGLFNFSTWLGTPTPMPCFELFRSFRRSRECLAALV